MTSSTSLTARAHVPRSIRCACFAGPGCREAAAFVRVRSIVDPIGSHWIPLISNHFLVNDHSPWAMVPRCAKGYRGSGFQPQWGRKQPCPEVRPGWSSASGVVLPRCCWRHGRHGRHGPWRGGDVPVSSGQTPLDDLMNFMFPINYITAMNL